MHNELPKRKSRKRHSIDLSAKRKRERSISKGFKIWAIIYASMMATGFVVASNPAHSATGQPQLASQTGAQTMPRLVTPNDMQTGALLFESKEPGRYIEAPRVASDIKVDVTGPIARTIITQKFLNPSDAWLEGVYVFPLPTDSAVDQLRMKIGDRYIEGIIKKKLEAKEIYEKAKREGKKASLLEQNRPNIFTNSVANIGPGESITVQIEYQQTIQRSADTFSLRVPLVVAPRYNPAAKPLKPSVDYTTDKVDGSGWGSADPVPDRDAITSPVLNPETEPKANPVTLSVNLKAGFALADVTSENHKVNIANESESTLKLSLAKEAVPADRDFVLSWKSKPGKTPQIGLFKQTFTPKSDSEASKKASQDYLLAYITPPYKLVEGLAQPARDITFVIDNSGSMAGPSMEQAKASLISALQKLKPQDRFNVIRFNHEMDQLFLQPVAVNATNIAQATGWVQALKAEGGTEMATAMQQALLDADPKAPTLRQVVFLTDGSIGNERQLFEIIKQSKGRSRIFTVGIGSAPNTFFMTRAAEEGKGTFTHINSVTDVKSKMAALFTKLSNPVATDLALSMSNAKDAEIAPNPLPDLYLGDPLVVAIKAKDLGSDMTLTGRFDNQPWSVKLDLSTAAASNAIDKLWARRKIRQLESDRLLSNQFEAIDKAIEKLGLDHHLVTRLTSLVAVDVTPSRPADEELNSKKVPLNLPDGWKFDKVFGDTPGKAPAPTRAPNAPVSADPQIEAALEAAPQQMAQFSQAAPMLARKAAPPAAGLAQLGSQKRSIPLPRTATNAQIALYSGLSLMIFGLFLAWRNRRPTV
jgi:Ca-activated chloride channel family protein